MSKKRTDFAEWKTLEAHAREMKEPLGLLRALPALGERRVHEPSDGRHRGGLPRAGLRGARAGFCGPRRAAR